VVIFSEISEQQLTVISFTGQVVSTQVTKIITPNVVAWARDHYNCLSADGKKKKKKKFYFDLKKGVELEEFGGSGTAGSHWEHRVANGEYMVKKKKKIGKKIFFFPDWICTIDYGRVRFDNVIFQRYGWLVSSQ
jgi:hypothetical protein